jgi:hypothetical protein
VTVAVRRIGAREQLAERCRALMEEAPAIELHRAEKVLLDDDATDDEQAHAVVLEERLRALRAAVEELEREVRARPVRG